MLSGDVGLYPTGDSVRDREANEARRKAEAAAQQDARGLVVSGIGKKQREASLHPDSLNVMLSERSMQVGDIEHSPEAYGACGA